MASELFYVDVKLNPAALYEMLESPTGEVSLWAARQAEKIAMVARGLASGAMVNVVTGRLRDSIDVRLVTGADGWPLTYEVIADAPYASFVHEGTRPHHIAPRQASVLRFPKSGTMLYRPSVQHPGTQPRPFLRVAMDQVIGGL
jgi:hypothetical protein